MENTLSAILMVAFLAIGLIGGAVLVPGNTEIEYVNVEVPVVEFVETTVTEIVEVEVVAPSQLDLAVAEFMKSVEDEEDEEGNDVNILDDMNYDFDEVSVSKVYDEWTIEQDDDVTTVTFEIKLKFDEDDERSEKESYEVEVIFEDDEDTIVNYNII